MQCGCQIETGGGDFGPDCFVERNPRARKKHICCECGGIIVKGERYRHESGIWDGQPKVYKTCLDCVSIRDTFFCDYIYGELYDRLWEYIQKSDGEVLTSSFAELTPVARDAVFEMIEQEWTEYYFEYPTQPSRRLEAKAKGGRRTFIPWGVPEWIKVRFREMNALDGAL